MGANILATLDESEAPHVDYINRYLFDWAEEHVNPEDSDGWESYKQVIAIAGSKVSISCLFEVIYDRDPSGRIRTATNAIDKPTAHALTIALLSALRYCAAQNADHKADLMHKFKTRISQYQTKKVDPTTILPHGAHWQLNPEFRKIVAGLDMILYRFRSHEFVDCRVATLFSRYAQCNALQSLSYLWEMLGWEKDTLIMYVWIKSVANDIRRLIKPDEEHNGSKTYLPYCVHKSIVSQSAYSSAINPFFNLFCHVIGGLTKNPRSLNAFYDQTVASPALVKNAMVLAYIVAHTSDYKAQAFDADHSQAGIDAYNSAGVKPYNMINANGTLNTPNDADPGIWLVYVRTMNGVGPRVQAWVKAQASSIVSPRDKTVGQYLKNTYGT